MHLLKTIKWQEPLELITSLKDESDNWLLLYSGLKNDFTGGQSILAMKPQKQITSNNFTEIEQVLSDNVLPMQNAWFGYLGYGLKNSLENLSEDASFNIDMPDLWMLNFGLILIFDHEKREVAVWAKSEESLQYIPKTSKPNNFSTTVFPLYKQTENARHAEFISASRLSSQEILKQVQDDKINKVENISSNMTKSEYLQKVNHIKQAIFRGDLYQANLTRKFFGKIKNASPIDIFVKLCKISPAPYASLIKLDDKFILSSSPERFISVSNSGKVDTRPIKGSAPRFADKDLDAKSKDNLQDSEKDRAENLMIVDLCRNDISRHCISGSVKTSGLFEVTSYATVHHMASTIQGQKKAESTTLELVKGCFPPGSMTGAPKIKAMQLCTKLEKVKRGIYSGAIGWFGGDGSADLSVVIRTIIIDGVDGDKFEFQVGGAIVADSEAETEFEESITKAKAVAAALDIDIEELKKL